jgi:hypothetical protein
LDDLCRESLIIYHIYYIYHIFGVCICWYSLKFNKALFMRDMTAQAKSLRTGPRKDFFCLLVWVLTYWMMKARRKMGKDMAVKDHEQSQLDIEKIQPSPAFQEGSQIKGRGVFVVQIVSGGVAVRSAMFVEGDRLLEMPAIFPDVHYAMAQIDELKTLVARHFAEAAQLGTQLIAAQIQAKAMPSEKQESPRGDVTATGVKP